MIAMVQCSDYRASMLSPQEEIAEAVVMQSPSLFIEDLDELLRDDEVWAAVMPPVRHGLEPITLATVAAQIRRRRGAMSERRVRIAAATLLYYIHEGTRAYRDAAWGALKELYT